MTIAKQAPLDDQIILNHQIVEYYAGNPSAEPQFPFQFDTQNTLNLLFDVQGNKRRVFGDLGDLDLMDNPLFNSKRKVFGFALVKEP